MSCHRFSALAITLVLLATGDLTQTTLAGEQGPTAYKGDEAESSIFAVPIDRYSDAHLGDPPLVSFDPIRGITINPRPDDVLGGRLESEIQRFIQNGITHFRFGLDWWLMEEEDGDWNLSVTDSLMNIVYNAGGEPLVILGYGSPWHMPDSEDCRQEPTYYKLPPKPDHRDAWSRYVDKVTTEYGDRIDYYEVWNEPDLSRFWYGTVDEYKLMLSKADSVLALRDPTAKVVLGGLAFPTFYDATWLQALLDQDSYEWFDIIGVHAYSAGQHHALAVVEEVFASEQLALKDIWVTETGYPSAAAVDTVVSTRAHERSQIDYIHRTMARWRHPNVKAVMWFNGFDRYGTNGEPDHWNMGLVDADGVAKPSLNEWATWSDALAASPLEARFDLNDEVQYRGIYPVEGALALPDGTPMPPSCEPGEAHLPTHAEEAEVTLADGSIVTTRRFSGADYERGLHFDVDDAWFYGLGDTLAVEIEYVSPYQVPLYFAYAGSECGEDQSSVFKMNPNKDCPVDAALPDSSTLQRHNCDEGVYSLDTDAPDNSLRRFSAVIGNAGLLSTFAVASDFVIRYPWCDFADEGPVYIKSVSLHKAPREYVVALTRPHASVHFESQSQADISCGSVSMAAGAGGR